jgi:hypothetical protein
MGTPPMCAGGGPPIVNPPGLGGCLGGLAATTFRWTLCSCKDVSLMDLILVDAFDSTKGPYMPGGIGGGVGADNQYLSTSSSLPPGGGIWGDLWVSSPMGLNNGGDDVVKHECRSAGPLTANGSLAISADAYAEGDVSNVTIGGKLYVPTGANVSVTPGGGIVRGPVSFPPPCDCAANQLVPVTAMVQAHASPNNDNAAIGLNENVLASPGGPSRLDLPCGSYYLTSVHPGVPVTIWAHGQTALYIGQDVSPSDNLAFGVDPTGAFDIFIAGTLSTQAALTIGSPNYPALTRTYIGSTTGISFSSEANVAGNIYAAFGSVDWSAGTDAYGSVFAGNFLASAAARIHYDAAVLQQGTSCPPPNVGVPPGDAGSGSGSGGTSSGGTSSGSSGSSSGGTPGCGSCRDCLNQACINGQCGSCQTSADCCSPLICTAGTCVPVLQ